MLNPRPVNPETKPITQDSRPIITKARLVRSHPRLISSHSKYSMILHFKIKEFSPATIFLRRPCAEETIYWIFIRKTLFQFISVSLHYFFTQKNPPHRHEVDF